VRRGAREARSPASSLTFGDWPIDVRLFLEQLESLPIAAWIQAGNEAGERQSEVIEARALLDTKVREQRVERTTSAISQAVQHVAMRLRPVRAPMVGAYRAFEALRAQTAADYAARALFLRCDLAERHVELLVGPFAYLLRFATPDEIDVHRVVAWRDAHSSVSKR
jgi:hypothetical protein